MPKKILGGTFSSSRTQITEDEYLSDEKILNDSEIQLPCADIHQVLSSWFTSRIIDVLLKDTDLFDKKYIKSIYNTLVSWNVLTFKQSSDLRIFLTEFSSSKEKLQRILDLFSASKKIDENCRWLFNSSWNMLLAEDILKEIISYLDRNDSFWFDYDEIWAFFSSWLAIVKKEGKIWMIKKNWDGTIIQLFPAIYDNLNSFSDDLYFVYKKENEKELVWLVDINTWKMLLENEYDEIWISDENWFIKVVKDGKSWIVKINWDKSEILLPCTLDSLFVRDWLILTKVWDKKWLYQIVDWKLICILETNYDKIEFDCEDLYIRMTINWKTWLMRRDENTKIWELFIEPLYERIWTIDFMNWLWIISDGNKEWLLKVFLNWTYKILCEPTYPEIGEIHIIWQDIYFFTEDAGYDYKWLTRIAENWRIDELISSNDKQYENITLRKDWLFELIDRNKNISLHEIVENRLIKIFEMLWNEIWPFKTDWVANTTKLSRNWFIKRYFDWTIEELFSCEYGWHSRYIWDWIFMMESWDNSKFWLYQEEDRTIKKILPMKYDKIYFDLEKDFYLFSNWDKVWLLLKSGKNIFVAVTPKSKLSVVQISWKMYVEYKNIWGKLVKKSFDEFLKKFK